MLRSGLPDQALPGLCWDVGWAEAVHQHSSQHSPLQVRDTRGDGAAEGKTRRVAWWCDDCLVRWRRWRRHSGRCDWYSGGDGFVIIIILFVLVVVGDRVLGIERITNGVGVGDGTQTPHLQILRTRNAWEFGGERGLCEDQSSLFFPVEADLGAVRGRGPADDAPKPGTRVTLVLPCNTDGLPEGKLPGQGGDGGAVNVLRGA